MRKASLAMLVVLGIGLLAPAGLSAAPVNGFAIVPAAEATLLEQVHCIPGWPHHRHGWDGCVRPRVIAPIGPVCRSVRVCGPRGCFWRRRCY